MPPRSTPTPRELAPGWPDAPCPDPAAEAIRRFVLNLRDAMGDASLRTVGAMTGVNHAALGKILTGESWPDARTVALLEHGIGKDLWAGPAT